MARRDESRREYPSNGACSLITSSGLIADGTHIVLSFPTHSSACPLAHTPTLTHTTLLYSTLSTLPYTLQHPLFPPTCPTPPNCPLQAQFSGAKHLNYVASSQSMRDLSSKQAYNQHGQTGGNNNTRSSSSSDHNLLYPPTFLSPTASEGGRHSWGTRRPGGLRRERPPPWSVIQAVGDRGMLGAMRRERRRDEEHREKLETSMSL